VSVLTCALGPDSAGTVLMRLIRDARHRIDAAIYEIGPSYRWALVRAAERGVRVRVVLDEHVSDGNAATAAAVIGAGGECRVAGIGPDAAHGKLLIADGTVAVGTGNLIWRDAPRDPRLRMPPAVAPLAGTREWWLTAGRSRPMHRAAAGAFEAHWATASAPPSRWTAAALVGEPPVGVPDPQVAPAVICTRARRLTLVIGGAAVAASLSEMVRGARRRMLVTVPYARTTAAPVRRLLADMTAASGGGVACGLLLGGIPDPGDAADLAALPFQVRRMDPDRSTSGHAKGLVADRAVLVSSANWSAAGLGGNWEAALRVEHAGAAAYYAAAWRRDWETSLPLDV
jgi:phosphatidylserine/phosphatidylglycerophosphate/cardiolipin synthase-like enzyme